MRRNPELPPAQRTLRELVEACWEDRALLARVAEILDQAEQAAQQAGAVCLGGGCCCKFDLAGHRLYVSVAELAMLCQEPPETPDRCRKNRCPYQKNSRCLARSRRPLGCRTYFCREGRNSRFLEIYESAHGLVRQAHEAAKATEYRYVELVSSIATLYCL